MHSIYNIFAALCSYMIHCCEDDSVFVSFSCISPTARQKIHREIYGKLDFLFNGEQPDGNPVVKQLDSRDLDEDLFRRLTEYIEELKGSSRYFVIICLLQILDEGLEALLLEKVREYQEDNFSVVLNTNRETTGIGLLPRTSCIWERRRRLSHSYNHLDNFLYNILLLENTILGELIDKHYFLKDNIFPDFERDKKITVAASPLRREMNFVIEEYERDMVYYCSIRHDEDKFLQDNEAIWQKIVLAGKNAADIMVFPEMLSNPETEEYIVGRLRSLSENEQQAIPSLILLPSLWKNNSNRVTVLDNAGNILCRQSKQNPYRMEHGGRGYLEDIKSSRVVNIFHHEGIGRIAVLICRDFLTTSYMEQLMRCFKLTLIIVPSYSTGSYDFRQSFDLCAHDDCNVVWINTCASMEEGKEANFENIGYVRKRIGRRDDDSQKLCKMPICRNAFSGKCTHDCIYYETLQGV